jgi:cell division protein ZapE
MSRFVISSYEQRVAAGEITADPAQRRVANKLDTLAEQLMRWQKAKASVRGLFSGARNGCPRGLYIYGGVGRGKTMLMDLFHSGVPVNNKQRVHFLEFMADVHERIARHRTRSDGDPLAAVAKEIAGEASLLCFDEFQVTDIADAMILGRLFQGLFAAQVVIVATSNVPPQSLYKDGLNRGLFLPFIAMLKEKQEVVELLSAKDYRLEKLTGRRLYFASFDPATNSELDAHWERLTGHHPIEPVILEIKGRRLAINRASMGVARLSFAELCEQPLGSLDYLHLAYAFHTLIIEDIPKLGPDRKNEARRFINLIDALYDNRVCLIASAAGEPHEIYAQGHGAEAFERTASRLIEMRSETYISQR